MKLCPRCGTPHNRNQNRCHKCQSSDNRKAAKTRLRRMVRAKGKVSADSQTQNL